MADHVTYERDPARARTGFDPAPSGDPVLDRPDPAEHLRVLVLGATGYVGGRLITPLLDAGHRVRCLARNPAKLSNRPWREDIDVVEGDLTDPGSLPEAFADVDVVVYLVHSLGADDDFRSIERACAANTAAAAARAGARQIVYLSGLGDPDDDLSPHLQSRHDVGRILAEGPVPVTELRAAVILGSGSASFEMVRGLVEVLPVMVTPRWVQATVVQPIAIDDVLEDLMAVIGEVETGGIWEIGGADVVTYAELMQAYARAAGLRRRLIVPVPVLTPRLSSLWVDLVTPLPDDLAKELVLGLQNDVVVRDRLLPRSPGHDRLGVADALDAALAAVRDLDIPTRWASGYSAGSMAVPSPWDPSWSGGEVLEDERTVVVRAPANLVMSQVLAVGGDDGWLGWGVLWGLRETIDNLAGGPGLRRGRRHPSELVVGDVVDLFVVEQVSSSHLRLRAEMKMPGYGWLEWRVQERDDGRSELTQLVRFVPRGLAGRAYWLMVVPFHALVFARMISELSRRAEAAQLAETAGQVPSPVERSEGAGQWSA